MIQHRDLLGKALTIWLVMAGAAVAADPQIAKDVAKRTGRSPTIVVASSNDPLDFSALYSGELNIWFSTSTNGTERQRAIVDAFHRDFPTFHINDRAIPKGSFTPAWQDESDDAKPDVAFIDNITELRPLLKKNAVWENWGSDRFESNGWWVIFRRSPHLESARSFVRWLAASPRWRPMAIQNDGLAVQDMKTIELNALTAVAALRAGKRYAAELLFDPDGARANEDRTYPGLKVTSAKPLQTFGNSHLAFTLIEVSGSSQEFYGLRYMSFIFRNHGDGWRILQLDRNTTIARADALFHAFDERMTSDAALPSLPAPVLAEPANNAKLALPVSRAPQLAWTMVTGAKASFLIEMQMNVEHSQAPPPIDPRDLTDSYLSFSAVPGDQPSYRIEAPFRVNAQPYRLRIWALDPSGQTSLSEWHAMYFVNTPPTGPVVGPAIAQ